MITAGIDVGIESIKIAILNDGKVVARGTGRSGGANRGKAVEQVWTETLKSAELPSSAIGKVVATGQGKQDVGFADDRVVEPIADARAARFLYPAASSVVDIGADQVRVVTLGKEHRIQEVVLNQKCGAGLGIFLKFMARRLGMTLEQMSCISPSAPNGVVVSDACSVFAELDALGLLNRNVAREEVARAIIEAVVVRINSILNDKIRPAEDSTVLIGGVAQNAAVTQALIARSGIHFVIPDQATYGGALGAALLATC